MNRATAVLLLAALAALPLCCNSRARVPASVLLIVVDTLRADHLGSYGYSRPTSPQLDELARRGSRFANARATSSWTLPSVASILTGLYPAVHGAEQSDSVLSEDLATMGAAFREAGYETAAFSANPAFVTPRQGLARGFDRFEVLHGEAAEQKTPGAAPANAMLDRWVMEATADDVSNAALQWLGARPDPARPFLLYLHYFDPHAAYTPPPELARRFGAGDQDALAGSAQWNFLLAPEAPPPDVLSTLVKLYDAEIAATDAAIGRLLGALPVPLRDSTVVVVTSDHGEEFGEHGGVQHGRTLYDELLRVPLILAGPGVPAGKVVDHAVTLAGLWSTLSELIGAASPPADVVEASFAAALEREPAGAEAVYADLEARFAADRQQHRRALVDGPWKLLLDPARSSELYDLAVDAGEQRSVGDAEAQRRNDLRTRILDRDAEAVAKRATAPPKRAILDPARREQLKALGYLQ